MALTIYFKVLTKFFLYSSYAIVCLGLCKLFFFLFCEKKVLFFLVLVSYMSAELNGLLVLITLMAKFIIASYLVCLLDSMTWFNCSAITLALVYVLPVSIILPSLLGLYQKILIYITIVIGTWFM